MSPGTRVISLQIWIAALAVHNEQAWVIVAMMCICAAIECLAPDRQKDEDSIRRYWQIPRDDG